MFEYLFDTTTPAFLESTARTVTIIIGFFVILGIASRVFVERYKKDAPLRRFWKHASSMWFTIGALGAFLVFLRQQQIYILGARIWMLLLMIGLGAWMIRLVNEYRKKVLASKARIQAELDRRKYLPK